MDTLKAIAQRYSVREFTETRLTADVLEEIVDAGRLAPTARNEQPWEFIIVADREALKRIGGMTDHGTFIAAAAACIVVLCRDTKYYLEDGCAATENMLLAATDLGVQSCWVAGDKKPYCPAIMEFLGVPSGHKLVSMVALGYDAKHGKPKPKRDLEEVLHWEKW